MSVSRIVLTPCNLQDKQQIATTEKLNIIVSFGLTANTVKTLSTNGPVQRKNFFYLRNTKASERER